jgi:hypothetical protein
MDHKLSIAERLAGSIQLDDQKLIDEIIESEIWNYDDDDDDDDNEATAISNEKHHDQPGECQHCRCRSPVAEPESWEGRLPQRALSCVCDLGIDEIFQGIERMKKEKTGGCQDDR